MKKLNVYIKDSVNNYTLISVMQNIEFRAKAKEIISEAFDSGISVTGVGVDTFYPAHMIHHITIEDE